MKKLFYTFIGVLLFAGTSYAWQLGQGFIDQFTPAYKDINMPSALFSLPAASFPSEDEFVDEGGSDTGVATLAFATGNSVSGSFELQHDYEAGTAIIPHVHWQGITAPAGGTDNVKWQLEYTFGVQDATLDAATTIVIESAVTTQYAFNNFIFPAITCASCDFGDQFLFNLSRVSASGDEYGGDALLGTFGVHYYADTLGSATVLSKYEQ
jgi:hypothetical protein